MSDATSGDEKYSHIDEKDKQSVVEKVATVQKWLEDQIARQSERAKNVDPVLTSAEIWKKKDEIIYFCHPLLAKPKPKVAVPNSGTETPKSRTETPNPPPEKTEAQGPSEMDVD
jgi:heat shock protein 4